MKNFVLKLGRMLLDAWMYLCLIFVLVSMLWIGSFTNKFIGVCFLIPAVIFLILYVYKLYLFVDLRDNLYSINKTINTYINQQKQYERLENLKNSLVINDEEFITEKNKLLKEFDIPVIPTEKQLSSGGIILFLLFVLFVLFLISSGVSIVNYAANRDARVEFNEFSRFDNF